MYSVVGYHIHMQKERKEKHLPENYAEEGNYADEVVMQQ
jgi:hypothetical protein